MLTHVSLRNLVLIDRLDIDVLPGLTVVTGETGAGKSVLLAGMMLALGARAGGMVVCDSAGEASAALVFSGIEAAVLGEAADMLSLEPGEDIILRRTVNKAGRSRAFVNDSPVSIHTLRYLGTRLASLQVQHAQVSLNVAETRRVLLDRYAGAGAVCAEVATCWERWRECMDALADLRVDPAVQERELAYLEHIIGELEGLAPEDGEESSLDAERRQLKSLHVVVEAVDGIGRLTGGETGAVGCLVSAGRLLESVPAPLAPPLQAASEAMERALNELDEVGALLEQQRTALDIDAAQRLEGIEERLFALRSLARKHGCAVDDLRRVLQDMADKRDGMHADAARVGQLEGEIVRARAAYMQAASRLHELRMRAADSLQEAVLGQLPALKMGHTRFAITVQQGDESRWAAHGMDVVDILIGIDRSAPLRSIAEVASGGELSRIMLALHISMDETALQQCQIFDEIDQGLGGAVATAVGQALVRLGRNQQVFSVTHAPQVAALADQHWLVSRIVDAPRSSSEVVALDGTGRQAELTRMLAGERLTKAAQGAAATLLAEAQVLRAHDADRERDGSRSRTGQSRTGQSRSEQRHAEQSGAERNRTGKTL